MRYLYANGVEMIHGDSGGVLFIGTEGKILVNRGKFEATPGLAGRRAAPATTPFTSTRATATQGLPGLHAQPQEADLRRGDRLPLSDRLPLWATWLTGTIGICAGTRSRNRFIGDEEANQWLDRPNAIRGRCRRIGARVPARRPILAAKPRRAGDSAPLPLCSCGRFYKSVTIVVLAAG